MNNKRPVCVRCGELVRGPIPGTVRVHDGHVDSGRDVTCGIWGWVWRAYEEATR